ATDAICSGLASTRPWPMADAARSALSAGFGYEPPAASTPSDQSALKPKDAAALSRAPAGSFVASPMNALLHEIANASLRSSDPPASASKFLNVRPSTVSVAGHGAGVAPLSPAPSRAADVTILNVDPGGYVPASARLKPPSGFDTTARTAPVAVS